MELQISAAKKEKVVHISIRSGLVTFVCLVLMAFEGFTILELYKGSAPDSIMNCYIGALFVTLASGFGAFLAINGIFDPDENDERDHKANTSALGTIVFISLASSFIYAYNLFPIQFTPVGKKVPGGIGFTILLVVMLTVYANIALGAAQSCISSEKSSFWTRLVFITIFPIMAACLMRGVGVGVEIWILLAVQTVALLLMTIRFERMKLRKKRTAPSKKRKKGSQS